jgi:hypothetical protein
MILLDTTEAEDYKAVILERYRSRPDLITYHMMVPIHLLYPEVLAVNDQLFRDGLQYILETGHKTTGDGSKGC